MSGLVKRKSARVFRNTGFALFEGQDSGFYSKMGAGFRIESICTGCGMRDALNNRRVIYGTERKFGSEGRD